MCGRYSLTTPAEAMQRLFAFMDPLPNLPPRYNIAPTQEVPVVRAAPGRPQERELARLRWGLVPFWAKDESIGNRLINARADGLAEKPAFRAAVRARRCLVPADGFYEWQAAPEGKRPHRIGLRGGTPEAMPLFAFAGLWERWTKAGDGVPLESFTIVTTDAPAPLDAIHSRVPVILAPADYALWLDPATPLPQALALLKPYPAAAMLAYPVSPRVNSVRYDDAACLFPDQPPSRLL